MDAYRIQLFLHVIAVIVGLGPFFAFPFLQGFAERRGTGPTRFALEAMRRIERVVIAPGAVLVFLFGLGLIFDDATGYSDDMPGWLWVSIAWYALLVAAAVGLQRRNVDRALQALEGVPDGEALPPAYEPLGRQMQIVGGLLGLSVIGIAFLMVWGGAGGF